MKKMLKCLMLILVLCLTLCACGKNEAVLEVEEIINQLPSVSLRDEQPILEAERAYDTLTEKQAKKVENYEKLVEQRSEYDRLAAEDPFAAEYWKLSDHDRKFVNNMGLGGRLFFCSKNKMPYVEIVGVWRDGDKWRVITLKEGLYYAHDEIRSGSKVSGTMPYQISEYLLAYFTSGSYVEDESYDLEKINEVINLYKFEGPYEGASWSFVITPEMNNFSQNFI